MESKLTLKLSSKAIEKGKRFARERGTSISRMVESYLERLTQVEEEEISPLVKSLSGLSPEKPTKEKYADYLEKKYK